MLNIRRVRMDDLPVVAEMMHNALDQYYEGDHRAHAKRIVETSAGGEFDAKGHFSAAQIMYVAEENDQILGVLNVVVKYQGTLKISPLFVLEEARGKGISRALFEKAEECAREYSARQIYATVSEKNRTVLEYIIAKHGFVRADVASKHYRKDANEAMFYKVLQYDTAPTDERIISILPLEEEDKPQVRRLVTNSLPVHFGGVDDRWVDSLFAGYDRNSTRDPNEKYKLIWVAKSPDGVILGVAAATPKKGEPIKLMPLITSDPQAFSALVAELPSFLREYGHKLYTHIVPTSAEVMILQRHGWNLEAMMPESYKPGIVTQQWGLIMEERVMKTMRVKGKYFKSIMAGTKPLEVRVGYESIKKIEKGHNIRLESGQLAGIVQVADVRVYESFVEMLQTEKAAHIAPDNPKEALSVLRGIYPADKEKLGVYVLELKVRAKA